MGLALVCWEGVYKDVPAIWLRWETLDGELLPTPAESAERAQLEAGRERQRSQELEALLERYRDRFGELPK